MVWAEMAGGEHGMFGELEAERDWSGGHPRSVPRGICHAPRGQRGPCVAPYLSPAWFCPSVLGGPTLAVAADQGWGACRGGLGMALSLSLCGGPREAEYPLTQAILPLCPAPGRGSGIAGRPGRDRPSPTTRTPWSRLCDLLLVCGSVFFAMKQSCPGAVEVFPLSPSRPAVVNMQLLTQGRAGDSGLTGGFPINQTRFGGLQRTHREGSRQKQ